MLLPTATQRLGLVAPANAEASDGRPTPQAGDRAWRLPEARSCARDTGALTIRPPLSHQLNRPYFPEFRRQNFRSPHPFTNRKRRSPEIARAERRGARGVDRARPLEADQLVAAHQEPRESGRLAGGVRIGRNWPGRPFTGSQRSAGRKSEGPEFQLRALGRFKQGAWSPAVRWYPPGRPHVAGRQADTRSRSQNCLRSSADGGPLLTSSRAGEPVWVSVTRSQSGPPSAEVALASIRYVSGGTAPFAPISARRMSISSPRTLCTSTRSWKRKPPRETTPVTWASRLRYSVSAADSRRSSSQ
jgi:hypothetical protein